MRRALLLVAGACLAAAAHGAQPVTAKPATGPQPIGRFFFTPAERAQLDIARIQKKTAQPASGTETAAAAAPVPPPPPQVVTYGGIVRRGDGSAMLWLNNRLVDEKEALSALNVKGRVRPDGTVTIQVPDSGSTIDVKVGQSFKVHSGKVAETRRPASEPKDPASETKSPAQPKQPEREGAQAKKPEAPPATALKTEPASP